MHALDHTEYDTSLPLTTFHQPLAPHRPGLRRLKQKALAGMWWLWLAAGPHTREPRACTNSQFLGGLVPLHPKGQTVGNQKVYVVCSQGPRLELGWGWRVWESRGLFRQSTQLPMRDGKVPQTDYLIGFDQKIPAYLRLYFW